MATINCGGNAETHAPQGRRVIFQPFTWHNWAQVGAPVAVDSGHVAGFAGDARDVAAGVRHVLQIIETDDIEADNGDGQEGRAPALFSVQVKANLLRLAVFALKRLELDCEEVLSDVDHRARAAA